MLSPVLDLQRRFGAAARIGGPMPQHIFFRPEAVERVLVSNHKAYRKGRLNAQFEVLDGLGLVTSEGDLWARQRRIAQPVFQRSRLLALGELMAEETGRALERWSGLARAGCRFDVLPELLRLTLQSAARTLFGVDLGTRAGELGPAVDDARAFLTWRMARPFAPVWIPTPLAHRFRRAKRTLDQLVYGLIAERRSKGASGRVDLLSALVSAVDPETGAAMEDRQVRDEVMTLLMAGHESTAVTLGWALFLLGSNPEIQARLREEVDGVVGHRPPAAADVAQLPYTRMVLEETLRLYPPVWAMSRQAIEEDVVAGFRVPKGCYVMLVQYAIHRLPELWPEPEAFRPERFTASAVASRPRYAYFPFGAGPRACIGNHFALMEAALVLAAVVQRFVVRVDAGHPVELEPQISLRLKGGTFVTLQSRRG